MRLRRLFVWFATMSKSEGPFNDCVKTLPSLDGNELSAFELYTICRWEAVLCLFRRYFSALAPYLSLFPYTSPFRSFCSSVAEENFSRAFRVMLIYHPPSQIFERILSGGFPPNFAFCTYAPKRFIAILL